MKKHFLGLLLFAFCLPAYANWHGLPDYRRKYPVKNFTRKEYQAGGQNWMLAQTDNGWIYVANNKGLLEYDGMNWTTYSMRDAKMRAARRSDDGRIYVGGISHFGYFEPDGVGGLRYEQMSDRFLGWLNFGVVRNILVDGKKVYFQTDRYIFWTGEFGGEVDFADCGGQISCTALFRHRLLVATERGLQALRGKELRPLTGADGAGGLQVAAMLPHGEGVWLLTRSNGLYFYDGLGLNRRPTGAEEFLKQKQMCCIAAREGVLAVGSVQDGVCLIDTLTGKARHFSTGDGLQNKTVYGLLFDADGNLWMALDNGIDRLELSSRLSPLGGSRGLTGAGYASCLSQNALYLGTNRGVYRMEADRPLFVDGTEGQTWSFLAYDGKLFCASDEGVFIIRGTRSERVAGIRGVRQLVPLPRHPDVLIAGTYGVERGLHLIEKVGGRWRATAKIEGCDLSCKSLLAESSTYLWMTNKGRGVYRLLLSDDLRQVRQQKQMNSFPMDGEAHLAWTEGDITVASRYGVWRFDTAGDSLVRHTALEQLLDGPSAYTYLYEDDGRNLWYASGGVLKLLRRDPAKGGYRPHPEYFLKDELIENFENVTVAGQCAIVGTEEGFATVTLAPDSVCQSRRTLQIRRVYLTGLRDSLLCGRSHRYDDVVPVIPYARNSLRMEYSVCDHSPSRPALFSYRLCRDGKEAEWSEYGGNCVKEFTGLHEGVYTFSVRLPADDPASAPATSFTFRILPPWYRTWWSYLLYAAAGALMAAYVRHRWMRSRKALLMQKRQELVRQQEKFEREQELKDRRIVLLERENLENELRHKSEELIYSTLNIVRKNEMLQDLRQGVEGISHSLADKDFPSVRRKILRLQGQIKTNIEHDNDLKTFQTSFDSVHHHFFERLQAAFPELTEKEKLLCAYVTMNLQSKEIAPLLNISVRGVEISRYRLRKKLALQDRDNLTEFLSKFAT